MLLAPISVCLALLLGQGRAVSSQAWSNAVHDVGTLQIRAVACNSPTLSQDLDDQSKVLGYANSACNVPQREWMLYESQIIIADQLACQCKTNYYDKIKTLTDVNVWLDCVVPAYVLLFAAVDAQHELEGTSLSTLYTDCSTLSASGAFPPVNPALDRAVQIVDSVLDWRGKLLNIMTSGLQKEAQGLILSFIVDGVHEATVSKASDFIDSKITEGYTPPPNDGVLRRQSGNSTTSPDGQYITDLTGIQVTVRLVPNDGYTMDDVQAGLQRVLTAQNFTNKMTQLNGNVTNMHFSVQKGNTTGTTGSGTMRSTTASASVTATTSASGASRSIDKSVVGTVWPIGLLCPVYVLGLGFYNLAWL